jgi:hypothetical protein
MSEHERENELAELLREVRALRQELEQLKGAQPEGALRDPNYAVLARTDSARDPDYAVLVRQLASQDVSTGSRAPLREPSYEVLVRQDFSGEDPEISQ